MHPVIAQAMAAERARELRTHAAVARRARQLRRSRHVRLFARLSGAAGGAVLRPAAWPVRGPRAA
jgi:hypothetical protein